MNALIFLIALTAAPALAQDSGDGASAASAATIHSGPIVSDVDYPVGPRDVLHIEVYDEEDLSGDRVVNHKGAIFIPLIGTIEVQGLSVPAIAQLVTERLEDGFLQHPQVSVEILEHKSQRVTVAGGVGDPGEYYLSGPTTLLELLARAGNIDREQSAREVLVRRKGEGTIRVTLDALVSTGEGDILLKGDDVVTVPEGKFVYIAGEVENPGEVLYWDGLTVTQALTKAGGPAGTARLQGAYILRSGEKIPVNLKRILGGRDADITLEPGDQLVVRESWL